MLFSQIQKKNFVGHDTGTAPNEEQYLVLQLLLPGINYGAACTLFKCPQRNIPRPSGRPSPDDDIVGFYLRDGNSLTKTRFLKMIPTGSFSKSDKLRKYQT